jgi:hypothetical protein
MQPLDVQQQAPVRDAQGLPFFPLRLLVVPPELRPDRRINHPRAASAEPHLECP